MRADRAKQLLKNGVYRAIGETVSGVGVLDGEEERTLRVLMYHKVNDLWPNPTSVPTAVFAQQMALLGELGYAAVSLDAVRDHYLHERPLPERAVLITFDDGRAETLSEKEAQLLRYLMDAGGRLVTRDEILRHLWQLDPARTDTRTLDMHVMHLRAKLGDKEQRFLATVRGKGYRYHEGGGE